MAIGEPISARAGHVAAPQRGGLWVSKTDLVRYLRCPYAWWLLERGEISFADTVDEFQLKLLDEGSAFQDLVEASAAPLTLAPERWEEDLLTSDLTVLATPTFENRRLHLVGRPDGIVAARGALLPVEVKSHRERTRTDELELAFYWLLLEPFRTRRLRPRGVLILRREGRPRILRVPISEERLREVRRLVGEIRAARRAGVTRRICGCTVCSRLRREEVLADALARADLTLIHGIGPHYACALEEMGVASWRDLAGCDSATVIAAMRSRSYFLSAEQIEGWRRHAASYATNAPQVFGSGPMLPEAFVALDLEYTPAHVWLIGACIRHGGTEEHHAFWADSAEELRTNLGRLQALLSTHAALPILTWAGDGADLPILRAAARRHGMPGVIAEVEARHIDMYQYLRRNARLPIPSMGLKEVGLYFEVSRSSAIGDGLAAQMMYENYRRARGAAKVALREQLLGYNRDDVMTLVEVAQRVREIVGQARAVAAGTLGDGDALQTSLPPPGAAALAPIVA